MVERIQSSAAQEACEKIINSIENLKLDELRDKVTSELHLEEADYKELPGEEALEIVRLRLGVIKGLASEHLHRLDEVTDLPEYEISKQFTEIFKMAAITEWPAGNGRTRYLFDSDAADAAVDELVGLYNAKLDRQMETE